VIEAPFVKKRKLTKVVEVATPEVEAKNVASFMAAQRKQMPKPFVPRLVDVEAFLANKLFEASPVNAAKPVLASRAPTSARWPYSNEVDLGSSHGLKYSRHLG
jgi:hypothetical protein